jgi:transposase
MSGGNFSRRYSVVAETRRCWSEAEKRAIIAEAARPGANISAVARRHGLKPSLLFRWRRLARDAKVQSSEPRFIPVTLTLPAVKAPAAASDSSADGQPSSPSLDEVQHRTDSRIEIELGNGRVVRVGAGVDVGALKRILDVLDGR